jgi:hypothetical protein
LNLSSDSPTNLQKRETWNLSTEMLNLRVARSPLSTAEKEAVLSEYNRLTSAGIPMEEFSHWLQDSPEGPAWHVLLETDEGEIVGHQSLIPFRGNCGGTKVVAAKSEYTFLREEFRSTKIRGLEFSNRPTHFIASRKLLDHCQEQGWGPILISTTPALHRWASSIGCRPVQVPLWECLLILRPWNAACKTPNLDRWRRATLCVAGLLQRTAWSPTSLLAHRVNKIRTVPLNENHVSSKLDSLAFFQDQHSLHWRYLEGQYERIELDAKAHEFIIWKKGSGDRYLRVCQWSVASGGPNFSSVASLVQMARRERALGVRWAFYGSGEAAKAFVRRMRTFGFLCARRMRTLLVRSEEEKFLHAANWNLTDAMFSFDP